MASFLRTTAAPDPAITWHQIQLLGHTVAYRLRKGGRARRHIGLRIDAQGLLVSLPQGRIRPDLDTLLQGKAAWIVERLQRQSQRSASQDEAQQRWRDHGELPFLGQTLTVHEDDRLRSAQWHEGLLTLPAGPASRRALRCKNWLREQARRLFEQRLQHWQAQMGGRITRISLSSARTRWGSATAQGHIRLNWRLIHFAPEVIDYVVCHELAHLQEMNHSPRFWAIVAQHCPRYREHELVLRQTVLPSLDAPD